MITVLYVDRHDVAGTCKDVPFDKIKIEHLRANAMRASFEADKVIFEHGLHQYILKDRT